jgi:Predicted transcriptional regulators
MMKLRELRKIKGLTLKELGDMVGVAESTMSHYETGKRSPDFETLLKFGEILECSVDYLLTGNSGAPEIKKDGSEEPLKLSDIEFALFGEVRELDDEDKAELLRDAQRMRELKILREKSEGK